MQSKTHLLQFDDAASRQSERVASVAESCPVGQRLLIEVGSILGVSTQRYLCYYENHSGRVIPCRDVVPVSPLWAHGTLDTMQTTDVLCMVFSTTPSNRLHFCPYVQPSARIVLSALVNDGVKMEKKPIEPIRHRATQGKLFRGVSLFKRHNSPGALLAACDISRVTASSRMTNKSLCLSLLQSTAALAALRISTLVASCSRCIRRSASFFSFSRFSSSSLFDSSNAQ